MQYDLFDDTCTKGVQTGHTIVKMGHNKITNN
jgi:hypothetical protein